MSVPIECLNMIIPVAVIQKKYDGGWEQCRQDYSCDEPGSSCWSDGELLRLGAMNGMDLHIIIGEWESRGYEGFVGQGKKKKWKDFCLFHSFEGPANCEWLSFDKTKMTVNLEKNMNFSSEVINHLVSAIKENEWDQKLEELYQWDLGKQLENLQKIYSQPWLDELLIKSKNAESNQTLRMTLTLREKMSELLLSDKGNAVPEINKWIVQDWGGIRRGDSTLQDCLNKAEDGIDPEDLDKKREFAIERIASWSKYLAFKYPEKYAIYDARVIYSLNWLLFKAGAKKYFPFLDGENSVMGLLGYNIHLMLEIHGKEKLIEDLKEDIENRKKAGTKSRLRTKLEKGIFIQNKLAFSEYCDLLKELAKNIFRDEEHGLTKVEMILYSVADKKIAEMVMDSFTGNKPSSAGLV